MKGLQALNAGGGAAVKMIAKSLRAIAVKFALVAWELHLPGCLSTVSRMPQMQLPIFAEGVHLITPNLGYQREGDHIVYLHGVMPVFQHHRDDMASFKMIAKVTAPDFSNAWPPSASPAKPITNTPADLTSDPLAKTLTITLHSLATPKNNAAVAHLCTELNATETIDPGTDLRMIFKSVSS